ncbi:phosphoinositide phosphatase [Grosmannia clavigera kw1407]|uniref:Phosphoinositide phosphatase n=1 Tax=Grosmannia clavigera (strain kw1407 / UAMH 11150) TaxID=655863 RepID=F0XLR8_GROCL|nr:phosphoinositide phosphatase [Grosmannia clavigera kw1407]EFX01383.1 phosphoinositide phosphatase [Grosmannia clavigera kw1407]
MPTLARKVIIYAAVDGLILQPLLSKKEQRASPPVKVRYSDNAILPASRDLCVDTSKQATSFEAFGIIGLISLSKFSYLISITKREHVATVRGSPIYVATEVALTPCASYSDANEAVRKTALHLQSKPASDPADDEDSNSNSGQASDRGDADPSLWMTDDIEGEGSFSDKESAKERKATTQGSNDINNSIAENVISRRGSYGRFAQRWFSRAGWMQEQKRLMGLTGDNKAIDIEEEAVGDESAKTDSAPSRDRPDGNSKPDPASSETPTSDTCTDTSNDTVPGTGPLAPSIEAADAVLAKDSAVVSLLPKLLRTTQMFFGVSRAFYFSYDYDITRSLAKQPRARWSDIPLHKVVDPLYFWNRHIIQPFIDAGMDALTLPLMQGFVGQRSFVVDSNPPQTDDDAKDSVELNDLSYRSGSSPLMSARTSSEEEQRPSEKQFDITLISRRSVKRAGLRYLRRGVDEDGNVANAVETEQILSPSAGYQVQAVVPSTPDHKAYSFVQIRGSIPLFFTQSPFSLKPVPVLQHSPDTNFVALQKHFDGLQQQYGSVQVLNLVEKHGVEAALGTKYEENVSRLNVENDKGKTKHGIMFEWFDFHQACKGMKFENVSLLLEILNRKLEELGSTVEEIGPDPSGNAGSTGTIVQQQKGVIRTNCMDCLDRTNVCQSSFAKFMLDSQLKEQGYDMLLQHDQENSWFNTVWADNGDAISNQYASTAAMKGDYTRTRKRDYRGALTDAGLSLTRFFNGIVNDFFLQTTIDFLLGNVTEQIFDEFEANMMTKDPAMSMQKMREQAIDLCQRRVVADESEEFVGGWTLLAPHNADVSLTAPPFEEVVLLLTDAALYLCRFDWNLEKLSTFERVDLGHVEQIKVGTYVLSTVSPLQTDEARNVGFAVSYRPGHNDILRINTRTLSNMFMGDGDGGPASSKANTLPSSLAELLGRRHPELPLSKRMAFKALYTDTSLATSTAVAAKEYGGKQTEKQQIESITAEIERLVLLSRTEATGGPEQTPVIVRADIVSLAEAHKSTGLLGHLGHSLKKLVWA